MNYETEFELEAMLYPITGDEHVAAANAIIDERVKRLHAERVEVDGVANRRLRELALCGIQAEVDKLAAVSNAIKARVAETSKPRRGRPPGSRTKPKVAEVGLDVRTHSDEVEQASVSSTARRANGHAFECLCDDCNEFWNEEMPNEQ